MYYHTYGRLGLSWSMVFYPRSSCKRLSYFIWGKKRNAPRLCINFMHYYHIRYIIAARDSCFHHTFICLKAIHSYISFFVWLIYTVAAEGAQSLHYICMTSAGRNMLGLRPRSLAHFPRSIHPIGWLTMTHVTWPQHTLGILWACKWRLSLRAWIW